MQRPAGFACAALLTLAVGCGGGSAAPGPAAALARSGAAPDVVLITVSGRNNRVAAPFCPPECNLPYLGDPGHAAEAVFNDLVRRGYVVARADYIAALHEFDDDGDGRADRFGFLRLVADLEWIRAHWMPGARIVVVGHSHGAVWAHLAAGVAPDVPLEVLVSLDGVCFLWEEDHAESVRDHVAARGGNPFPFDVAAPCARWVVPGRAAPADTDDIAFPNVAFNLEVQSNGVGLGGQDTADNVRLDGARTGIRTFASASDDHFQVYVAGRSSMAWVLGELALILD